MKPVCLAFTEDTNLCVTHAKCVTIMPKDIQPVCYMCEK